MTSTITIDSPVDGSIPTCSLHLMPFRIEHTGPAPISTYFRPQPAPIPTFGKTAMTETTPAVELQPDSTEGISQTTELSEEEVVKTQDVEMSMSAGALLQTQASGERFVAAFRGREVRGATVDLPEGYSGIVLKSSDDGQGKPGKAAPKKELVNETRSKSSRRAARNSRRVIDVDDEVEDAVEDADAIPEDQEQPTRTLNLASKFSSFVLWNPDIPVDEGKDEYLRSLSEWTKLSAEASVLYF
jgi:hypothetical protein